MSLNAHSSNIKCYITIYVNKNEKYTFKQQSNWRDIPFYAHWLLCAQSFKIWSHKICSDEIFPNRQPKLVLSNVCEWVLNTHTTPKLNPSSSRFNWQNPCHLNLQLWLQITGKPWTMRIFTRETPPPPSVTDSDSVISILFPLKLWF